MFDDFFRFFLKIRILNMKAKKNALNFLYNDFDIWNSFYFLLKVIECVYQQYSKVHSTEKEKDPWGLFGF